MLFLLLGLLNEKREERALLLSGINRAGIWNSSTLCADLGERQDLCTIHWGANPQAVAICYGTDMTLFSSPAQRFYRRPPRH